MRQTFITTMPDHVGAFLQASRAMAQLGLNITRVSYNRAIDVHTLFIEAEGEEDALARAVERLEEIGYLRGQPEAAVLLVAFRLRDGITALGYPFPVSSPSNQQFPVLPNGTVAKLQELGYEFEIDHPVDNGHTCIRLVTSWATPERAMEAFLRDLAAC